MARQPSKTIIPKNLVGKVVSRTAPKSPAKKGEDIRNSPAYPLLNHTVKDYRKYRDILELIRHLAHAEGPFATAVHNMVEVASTDFSVLAYDNNTHDFSPEGTRTAMSVVSSMDTPTDYSRSTHKLSVDETVKLLLRETVITGMPACELVLNEARMPDHIQVVGSETLQWKSDGKGGSYPVQDIAGKDKPVSLDIPSFFYSRMNPDPAAVHPRSMMEAAVKLLVYFEEFMEDIRRSVRISGHNRMVVSLDEAKIIETMPASERKDAKKVSDYLNKVKQGVEDSLASLSPEDALTMYSSAKAEVLQSGTGSKIDYTPLLNVVIGQYATAMKSSPSALGMRLDVGSQQTGSTEATMFLKSAEALHTPVETIMSRVLTLACRLMGADIYVWFRFNPPNLRPEDEREAFATMRQTRILGLLSLGLISDDEAALELGTFPRPPGSPNLSGTMFMHGATSDEDVPGVGSGDTPTGRDLRPNTPTKGGGRSQ